MSKNTFLLCRIALIIAGGLLTLWAVLIENYIILPIWVVGGIGLLFFLRSKVKEVVVDERSVRIKELTSVITFQVVIIIAALTSIVMLLLGKRIPSDDLMQIGMTVGYLVSAALVIYCIMYMYYLKKY
jgi:uncharacterized membrane protein